MLGRWTRPALGGGLAAVLFAAVVARGQQYPVAPGPVPPAAPPWEAPPVVIVPPAPPVAPAAPPQVYQASEPLAPIPPAPPQVYQVPVPPLAPPQVYQVSEPPAVLPNFPVPPTGPVYVLPVPPPPDLPPGQEQPKGKEKDGGQEGAKDGGQEKDDGKPKFDISWRNGVFFRTADKDFSLHLGGTIHYDGAWYQASPLLELAPGGVGKFDDGVNLRRARFAAEGTLYRAVDFKLEIEFANGFRGVPGPGRVDDPDDIHNAPAPTHAWVAVRDVPFLGTVRVGNQKEFFSLEHMNSHRFLQFMERSYLFDFSQPSAFNNGYTPGIAASRTWADDLVFTAVGVYKNIDNQFGFGLGDGEYAVTGRVAGMPVRLPQDQIYWHVGGAMSHRHPVGGEIRIRVRDQIRNAPFPLLNVIADTGRIDARAQDLFNLETAVVWGPLTFQSEYTANVLRGVPEAGVGGVNLFFQGYYAEVMCFLTGESRDWNVADYAFDRVKVLRPVRTPGSETRECGCGAWEVGVRYSYLDLSNRSVQAGRLDAVTLGLNWYLNDNAKVQWNYDLTRRGDTNNAAQGTVHSFGMRCALDF